VRYVLDPYAAVRSLREFAELKDRSFSVVRSTAAVAGI
jgi:hypothetical protein